MNFKSAFLTVSLALFLVPISLSAQDAPDQEIIDPGTKLSTEQEIKDAAKSTSTEGGIYYISDDIAFSAPIEITNNNFLLRSELTTEETQQTISGGGANSMFYIKTSSTTLSNLKFSNGLAESSTLGTGEVSSTGGALKIEVTTNPANGQQPKTVSLDSLTFENNKAESTNASGGALANGGAIYIKSQQNTAIANSTFTKNTVAATASSGMQEANGGAIFAEGSGNVTISSSTFSENEAQGGGGAVTNVMMGKMEIDNSTFETNKAARGGAVLTFSKLNIASSDFKGNEASQDGGAAFAFNGSELTLNKSNFEENIATGNGGAIYNDDGALSKAQSTSFTKNKAVNGGGIYNFGNLDIANYNQFNENSATTGSGGAIYNVGDLKVGASAFNANTSSADGGAIYTSSSNGKGNINFSGGVFTNNTATGLGGAIYADAVVLNMTALTDITFSGNTDSTGNNAITLSASTLNLNPVSGAINFHDKIAGDASSIININDPLAAASNGTTNFYITQDKFLGTINSHGGTLGINGDIDFSAASAFNMGNTNLSMLSGTINTVNLGNFTATGNNFASIDIDLENGLADQINSTSGTGNIYIQNVKLLGDSLVKDTAPIQVSNNLNIIFDAAQKHYGPIFLYTMNSIDPQHVSVHQTDELTPSVLGATISQNAIYANNMLISNALLDRVGVMLSTDGRYYAENKAYKTPSHKKQASRVSFGANEITQKDFYTTWFVPYASNQKLDLDKNLSGIKNNAYGATAGVDLPVISLGDFGFIPTIFAGYGGAEQKHHDLKLKEDSLLVGLMATFYQTYFYTTIETHISNGSVVSELGSGRDKFDAFSYTVSSRTELKLPLGSLAEFRPGVFLAYNFTSAQNYTTDLGANIKPGNKNTFQVAPEAKLIADIQGWHPYLNFAYAFNAYDDHTVQANAFTLPDFGLKNYYKYGAGIENTFLENYSGYAQVAGYGGGIKGFSVQIGLRGYLE